MIRQVLATMFVAAIASAAGCKPAAPPEKPLAAQRKVMKQASELGEQLQQQSDQRLKSLDETK